MRTPGYAVSLTALALLGAACICADSAVGQDAESSSLQVVHGTRDPEAIPMVKAYESIVWGYLLGTPERGINFLVREVRLHRKSAEDFFSYAQNGWKQLVAMQLGEAEAVCDEGKAIQSKTELAQVIMSAKEREDALRLSIYEGAFEILDEKDGERLRRYVARNRSATTTHSYDVESSITDSPDSLATMIRRICSYE